VKNSLKYFRNILTILVGNLYFNFKNHFDVVQVKRGFLESQAGKKAIVI